MKKWMNGTLFTALRLGKYRREKTEGKRDSASLSRPQCVTVHGVTVKKAPVGRYLDLMKRLPNVVMELLDAAFPDMKPGDVLTFLSSADDQAVRQIITRLFTVLPGKLVEVMCDLMDIDADWVSAKLTPAELLDVWTAFFKLNDYTDFFENARRAMGALRANQAPIGFSDGSPAGQASESASAS